MHTYLFGLTAQTIYASQIRISVFVPCVKNKTGSRVVFMSGPVPICNAQTFLTFQKLLKSPLFDLAFSP